MIEHTTYTISCDDESRPSTQIVVNADEMIVYDVCKIADYQGGDYVARVAREHDYVVHPTATEVGQAYEEEGT